MKISELPRDVPRLFNTGLSMPALRRVRLFFHAPISPRNIMAGHAPFNRAHARFPLIKDKTSEIALIDLSDFNSSADYVATVKKTTLIDNSPLGFFMRHLHRDQASIARFQAARRSPGPAGPLSAHLTP
jgi:hypothetical protein